MEERARARLLFTLSDDLDNLRALQVLFEETGNPLFVWDAIAVTNRVHSIRALGLETPDLPAIPHWGRAYMVQAAINLCKLTAGDSDAPANAPLTGLGQALDLVPKQGSSRFVEYRGMRRDIDIADAAARLKAVGKSAVEIDSALRSQFGNKDPSVLRKRVTNGSRLRERIEKLGSKNTIN